MTQYEKEARFEQYCNEYNKYDLRTLEIYRDHEQKRLAVLLKYDKYPVICEDLEILVAAISSLVKEGEKLVTD